MLNYIYQVNIMNKHDTITAIATPPGPGAIAVIRISGANAISVADKIFSARTDKPLSSQRPNSIVYGTVKDDETIIDDVLVSLFKAPHSYTGEDTIEISCHGSLFIQQKLLNLIVSKGARLAEPGEFTQRAFLNGKMDLSQAEAVADLIASSSAAAHQTAIKQMRGGFSNKLQNLRDGLMHFASLIELELDFSEEDVEFAERKELTMLINKIMQTTRKMMDSFALGNVIKQGIPVAIVGKTNVGKSTLLNTLLNEDKAIISEYAGTTRDAIEDMISIEGYAFRFIDTAGLRDTDDKIESIGINKTYEKLSKASIVLLLTEPSEPQESINKAIDNIKNRMDSKNSKLIVLLNKSDMAKEPDIKRKSERSLYPALSANDKILAISAKNNVNIDQLNKALLSIVKDATQGTYDVIVTNARHYEALRQSYNALQQVSNGLKDGISEEFLARDIREALHYLGLITGEVTTDDILGNIFRNFCIGK